MKSCLVCFVFLFSFSGFAGDLVFTADVQVWNTNVGFDNRVDGAVNKGKSPADKKATPILGLTAIYKEKYYITFHSWLETEYKGELDNLYLPQIGKQETRSNRRDQDVSMGVLLPKGFAAFAGFLTIDLDYELDNPVLLVYSTAKAKGSSLGMSYGRRLGSTPFTMNAALGYAWLEIKFVFDNFQLLDPNLIPGYPTQLSLRPFYTPLSGLSYSGGINYEFTTSLKASIGYKAQDFRSRNARVWVEADNGQPVPDEIQLFLPLGLPIGGPDINSEGFYAKLQYAW